MVRRVLGVQRRPGDGSRGPSRERPARRAAGHPVQPVQPRAGERPRRRAGRGGQGRERLGLRGPLLLGLRGLRRAVPHLHEAGRGAEPHALPAQDAARGPAPGPGDGPERGALPVAHDQRRGGVGLLRRGHGPGAHRRRHRLRARAVRRGVRRPRLPGPRRDRHPRRDVPDVGRPRVLAQQRRRPDVPHPRRDRPGRVHDRRQQQPVHQRDGPLQPRADRGGAGPDPGRGAGGVRAGRRPPGARGRRGRGVDALRRGHAHPVRRGARHPPAGRLLPRPRGVGPVADAGRAAAAAPALPPAGDLPVPGAQAGRRGARAVPAGRPLHRRGEARRLRVLRPDHHRGLDAVGGRAVDHRGGGRLPRRRVGLLPAGRSTST